jgi:hypothetical protein
MRDVLQYAFSMHSAAVGVCLLMGWLFHPLVFVATPLEVSCPHRDDRNKPRSSADNVVNFVDALGRASSAKPHANARSRGGQSQVD